MKLASKIANQNHNVWIGVGKVRRSFISATTVNRIMAAQRKREKDARDRDLIAASQSALKELPPHC